ncbi:Hypothetical protein PBC10988_17770 [Planctomycetales bacterium 10988]|nr:Hypothetical protein PBC10988_17770 [Planctomycetales bacterium 10988]
MFYPALKQAFDKLTATPTENFYGFVIYTASGWQAIGASASSLESIDIKQNLNPSTKYLAWEWEYMDDFEEISEFLCQWSDDIFDDGDKTIKYEDWYDKILQKMTATMLKLKETEVHKKQNCVEDFYWGLQFSDPYGDEIDTMKKFSQAVNTKAMHAEFCQAFDQLFQEE